MSRWLGLQAFTADGPNSVPGRVTEILQAAQHGKKKKKCGMYMYIYIMEYYSAIKKSEIMPLVVPWIDLEIITLSEGSQRQRQMPYDITYMWNLEE